MPKIVRDSCTVAQIHFLAIWRDLPIYFIMFTLFPLSFLFFANYIVPEGVPVGSRLITGSIVFTLGVTIVNGIAQELLNRRFNNQLKLVIVAPVRKLSFAAGIISDGLLRGAIGAFVIIVFAPLFGIHIEFSLWLLPLTLLSALSLTGVALVIGTWSPTQEIGNVLTNTIGILIVFFSPIYYPLSRLPEWLQWPARLSPYTHAGSAIDAVLSGRGGFYGETAILAAITAVALVLGVAGMRWRDV